MGFRRGGSRELRPKVAIQILLLRHACAKIVNGDCNHFQALNPKRDLKSGKARDLDIPNFETCMLLQA